jgi:hypothetical protein
MSNNINQVDQYIRPEGLDGALLNSDAEALKAYKATKRRFNQLNNIEHMQQTIDSMAKSIEILNYRIQQLENTQ